MSSEVTFVVIERSNDLKLILAANRSITGVNTFYLICNLSWVREIFIFVVMDICHLR